MEKKTLDREIPIITTPLQGVSYAGMAKFQLPEPELPLSLYLEGRCWYYEGFARWSVSGAYKAKGEYAILVEDV